MKLKIKLIFTLIIFTILINCKKEEIKLCVNRSPDIRIKLYNELTDQLIYNFFGDEYLNRKHYFDSLRVNNKEEYIKESTKAHNLLFNNKKEFCNLYIDSARSKSTDFSKYSDTTKIKIINEEKEIFKNFPNKEEVIKNLSVRSSIKANQFNLCTANVLDLKDKNKNVCEVGIVYFSEVTFDKSKRNAVVYVNYRNSKRVLRTYIFKLTLTNNYWELVDMDLLAIS